MSSTITPIGMRVLLECAKKETKTQGGIYIPDSAANERKDPREAVVVAVGTGSKDEAFKVAVGDTVLITGYGGVDVKVNDKKYVIINEIDILAIIKKED